MKTKIMNTLQSFGRSRPGFEPANYATMADYRRDYAQSRQALHDAEAMAAFIWRTSITAADIMAAARGGRLTITVTVDGTHAAGDRIQVDYVAGQYYPVEYRPALCHLYANVIWAYFRDGCNYATADDIRRAARKNFGPAVARRWFK